MKSKNYAKRIFLCVWSVLIITGIFFGVRACINGDFSSTRNLEILDLHICSSPSDLTTRVTLLSQRNIKNNSIQLFVCGVIQSNRPERLGIYVYEEPGHELVFYNRTGDIYPPGELFFPIDLNKLISVGDYKVVIYFYRNIVGNVTFTVTK